MYLLIAPPKKIRKTDRAMEEEKTCNLEIGLGVGSNGGFFRLRREDRGHPVEFHLLFPLHPKEEISSEEHSAGHDDDWSSMAVDEEEKEEEEEEEEEEGEHNKMINIMLSDASKSNSSSSNDNVKKYGTNRKKLKLSKEQLALLEDYFNSQSTLNLTQKQELALQLNLQPRQVEVWFQNRRSRTKQKQVERDCEFWKKCYDNLSEENKRLKEELEELRTRRFTDYQKSLTKMGKYLSEMNSSSS